MDLQTHMIWATLQEQQLKKCQGSEALAGIIAPLLSSFPHPAGRHAPNLNSPLSWLILFPSALVTPWDPTQLSCQAQAFQWLFHKQHASAHIVNFPKSPKSPQIPNEQRLASVRLILGRPKPGTGGPHAQHWWQPALVPSIASSQSSTVVTDGTSLSSSHQGSYARAPPNQLHKHIQRGDLASTEAPCTTVSPLWSRPPAQPVIPRVGANSTQGSVATVGHIKPQ